ncbi:unnamed protein product, partial [marine sediment metagenome]
RYTINTMEYKYSRNKEEAQTFFARNSLSS